MPLAGTSRTNLRYAIESVYGTIPSTPAPETLRMTGESLAYTIGKTASSEIRGDRQTLDLVPTSASAGGGVNFEMSYREYDDFLQAALQGTWVQFGTNGVGASIPTSATFAAGTLTAGSATSSTSIFTALALGQWVKIAGSTITGQNIWAQVSLTVAPTSTVLTFQGTPFTGLTGNGGTAVTVSASRLVNGTTLRSFSIEREFADIAQFFVYKGMNANKLNLSFASGAMITGSLDFLGKDGARAAATQLIGTPTVSTVYDILNGVSSVSNVLEGGAALSGTFIKSATISLDNKLRGQGALGVLGNAAIGNSTFDLQGSLEVYLADGTYYDKFIANTASSFSLRMADSSGNGYVITIPNLKYGDAKVTAGSKDQDAMLSLPWNGLKDTTTGASIIIDRAGA